MMCAGVCVVEQPPRHLEAGQPRHLHVEEHDVGLQPLDRRQRFDAVAGLADDLDAADLAEQVAELVARQLLVVDEDRAQIHRHAVTRSGTVSSGISTLAHVPRPGSLVSFSWQLGAVNRAQPLVDVAQADAVAEAHAPAAPRSSRARRPATSMIAWPSRSAS